MKEEQSLTAVWNPEFKVIEIFKLGNDGNVYRWDKQKHNWSLYA